MAQRAMLRPAGTADIMASLGLEKVNEGSRDLESGETRKMMRTLNGGAAGGLKGVISNRTIIVVGYFLVLHLLVMMSFTRHHATIECTHGKSLPDGTMLPSHALRLFAL